MANTNKIQHLNAEHRKTNRMKMFAKENPWRPIYIACVLFLVIGYLFYFAAYLPPTPQWGRDLMTWAMPTLKGLDSAARVAAIKGTDPFPAQVVIVYCALGSILLIGWCLFWLCYSREARKASLLQFVSQQGNSWRARVKAFCLGIVGAFSCLFGLYVFFWLSSSSITWHNHKFHSSSIGSASFLIVTAMLFSFMVAVFSILFIYIPFSKYQILSKEIN